MKVSGAAFILVALVLAGCSSGATTPRSAPSRPPGRTTSASPAAPTSPTRPTAFTVANPLDRRAYEHSLAHFLSTGFGRYHDERYAYPNREPAWVDDARYGRGQLRVTRRFQDPQSGALLGELDVVTRSRTTYVQSPEWKGPWHGCWLSVSIPEAEAQTGLLMSAAASPPVLALQRARFVRIADEPGTALATVPGGLALQLLGVPAKTVAGLGNAVFANRVPIAIDVAPNAIVGFRISGEPVRHALSKGGVRLTRSVVRSLKGAVLSLEFTATPRPPTIAPPRPSRILPPHPSRYDSCPAKSRV